MRSPVLAFAILASVGIPAMARAETLHLKTVEILDTGWSKPVPGYSFLAPADWHVTGGIKWNGGTSCPTHIVVNDVRIVSPDGRFAIEILPDYGANGSDDPAMLQYYASSRTAGGCPVAAPMDAKKFVSTVVVPAVRPHAKVTGAETLADVAETFRQETTNELGSTLSSSGMQTNLTADAAKVMLSHGESNEEILAVTAVLTMRYVLPSTDDPKKNLTPASTMTMSSRDFAYRFPPGEAAKAEPIFATLLSSIRINPAWNKLFQDLLRHRDPIIDHREMMLRIQREVLDSITDDWRATAPTSVDPTSAAWGKALGGAARYHDEPLDADVVLPEGYASVWSNGKGEYLLSTIADFKPPTGETWTQIKPVS